MNLPNHIIDNIERRWAAKLQREVEAWRKQKPPREPQEPKPTRTDRPRVVRSSRKIPRVA